MWALILLALVLLLLVAAMAWGAYEIVTLKQEKASVGDLDAVVDELEALSQLLHRGTDRLATRLDQTAGDVRSANSKDVEFESRLAAVRSDLDAFMAGLNETRRLTDTNRTLIEGTLTHSLSNLQSIASKIESGIDRASQQFIEVPGGALNPPAAGGGAPVQTTPPPAPPATSTPPPTTTTPPPNPQ